MKIEKLYHGQDDSCILALLVVYPNSAYRIEFAIMGDTINQHWLWVKYRYDVKTDDGYGEGSLWTRLQWVGIEQLAIELLQSAGAITDTTEVNNGPTQ